MIHRDSAQIPLRLNSPSIATPSEVDPVEFAAEECMRSQNLWYPVRQNSRPALVRQMLRELFSPYINNHCSASGITINLRQPALRPQISIRSNSPDVISPIDAHPMSLQFSESEDDQPTNMDIIPVAKISRAYSGGIRKKSTPIRRSIIRLLRYRI